MRHLLGRIVLFGAVITVAACRTDTDPVVHPIKDLGLVTQTAERLTRYGYPLTVPKSNIEKLSSVPQGNSEVGVLSQGTYKVYLGPKPSKNLQPVKLVVVPAAEANSLGALDTCLAFSASRAIVCSENFESSVGGQVIELFNDHLSKHPSPQTDTIAAEVAAAGPKPIVYSLTLGLIEFALLHELSHVYRRDAQVIDNSNATSVAGLCGGPDPAAVSNELVADMIAVDMLDKVQDFAPEDHDFPGKNFALLATESLRFMLLTIPDFPKTSSDRCAFYREFCRSSRTHLPYLQRLVLNVSIILANQSGDDEVAKAMGKLFDDMRELHDSGECGAVK
jgi:hypothetical protein